MIRTFRPAKLNMFHRYSFGGRRPIVLVQYVATPTRVTITGYTPKRYQQWLKRQRIETKWPYRTFAEIEGIAEPPVTTFTVRYDTSVVDFGPADEGDV